MRPGCIISPPRIFLRTSICTSILCPQVKHNVDAYNESVRVAGSDDRRERGIEESEKGSDMLLKSNFCGSYKGIRRLRGKIYWGEPERAPPGRLNGCSFYIIISGTVRPSFRNYLRDSNSISTCNL